MIFILYILLTSLPLQASSVDPAAVAVAKNVLQTIHRIDYTTQHKQWQQVQKHFSLQGWRMLSSYFHRSGLLNLSKTLHQHSRLIPSEKLRSYEYNNALVLHIPLQLTLENADVVIRSQLTAELTLRMNQGRWLIDDFKEFQIGESSMHSKLAKRCPLKHEDRTKSTESRI